MTPSTGSSDQRIELSFTTQEPQMLYQTEAREGKQTPYAAEDLRRRW